MNNQTSFQQNLQSVLANMYTVIRFADTRQNINVFGPQEASYQIRDIDTGRYAFVTHQYLYSKEGIVVLTCNDWPALEEVCGATGLEWNPTSSSLERILTQNGVSANVSSAEIVGVISRPFGNTSHLARLPQR